MTKNLATSLQNALIDFLSPLQQAARDPRVFADWLAALGYPLAVSGDPALTAIIQHAAALHAKLSALNSESLETWTGLVSLLQVSKETKDIVQELRVFAADPARVLAAGELAEEMMSLLLASSLRRKHATAFRVASLLTLVDSRETAAVEPPIVENGAVLRYGRVIDRFRFSRLNDLITHPNQTLKDAYFPNAMAAGVDAWRSAGLLFPKLSYLANVLGLARETKYLPTVQPVLSAEPDPEEALLGHVIQIDEDETAVEQPPVSDAYFAEHFPSLRITIAGNDGADLGKVVAVQLLASSRKHPGAVPGIILTTIGEFNHIEQREQWRLTLSADGEIPGIVIGPDGLRLAPGGHPLAAGSARLLVERVQENPTDPAFLFGSQEGSRLELGTLQLAADLSFNSERADIFVTLAARSGALVIAPGDGDGFLGRILPADGLRGEFDLGLAWSSDKGLTLRGSAGLGATLPISLSVAGVTLSTVHLSLQPREASVLAEVSASIAASIGPVRAVVDRVGIAAAVSFPEAGGNLGLMELDCRFKPPSGIGLSVDTQGLLTGGGFLAFDPAKQEYAGILQLEIAETIAVKAVGLLTTRMPDGSKGYSLVILITAEDFAPIQLGFGFTLTGIGGLLGINRTVAVDVLRGGLKNGTLGSILFPADPIRNAPQIVSDLRAVFPPTRDRHVFGPMAQIEWGTPTLLTLQLALILELPEPVRLIILGRLLADLPDAAHSLVRLRMDAVGLIDFNRNEIALDATLYDSRILEFALSGDMALRANWGARPDFVLAVGGFNPRYPVPAGFPRLQRLTLSLGDGDNPRLRFESYLALTSNTVQFGGRLDFAYTASGFTLIGFLGMDALFQFEPFAFVADIGAMVALKRGRSTLMSVGLEMSLAGPTPWHVWGKAKFKILFFTVKIGFDQRFGHDQPPPLPEPVDALALLVQALNDRRNWSGALPRSEPAVVTLRETAAGRLHPLARLSVRQRVVPLNRTITLFGNAPLAGGASTFAVTVTGGPVATYLQEAFAPAQYQDYSDDDKLAQPAFVDYDAGLGFAGDAVAYQYEALPDLAIVYETQFIDPTRPPDAPPPPAYTLPVAALTQVVDYAAAAIAPIRSSSANRYRNLEQAA